MSNRQRQQTQVRGDTWRSEIKEVIGGASGGFLFGIPLIYTTEVWFIGSYVRPAILLAILAITFVIVLSINRIEGFRPQESETVAGAIAETIETLAIGITCATLMLIILQRIDLQTSLTEALGKIVFEGVPFSLGVAFSRSLLCGEPQANSDDRGRNTSSSSSQKNYQIWQDTAADFSATVIGALFIAFSIAPTDEVKILAASASAFWLLLITIASLLISYGIVFTSGITNYQHRLKQSGLFQTPQSETIMSYLVSLLIGMLMLWFFQKLTWSDPWFIWLRYSIILGLPASIGGAAGRLAV
ncbi:MAG: TIGR02587 family membrane protein [Cyanobacteria bacterium J06621_12]